MSVFQTSQQLLDGFKLFAGRPSPDEGISDPEIFALLEQGQRHVYGIFASHVPDVLYGDPTIMSTSDSKVYTFASSVFPLGSVEIRSARNGQLLTPGTEWDSNADFVWEGDQIRIPNNRTRSFSSGPYARYISIPTALDADNEPSLKPPHARILILYHALYLWAEIGGGANQVDPNRYLGLFQSALSGDTRIPGDIGILGQLKTQGYGSGMAAASFPQPWYRGSPDLG
jgi:hypothetical protein